EPARGRASRHARPPAPRPVTSEGGHLAMKLFDLSGRVAIVTGGNGGIGLGMARGLGQAGAAVVVAGRQAAKSRAAVKEPEALGAQAAAGEVDRRREPSVPTMVQGAAPPFGRLASPARNPGPTLRQLPQ